MNVEQAQKNTDSSQQTHLPKEVEFLDIVFIFSTAALHSLGVIHVEGKEPKVDMNAARFNIDCIAKLKEKTTNNLTQAEQRVIDELLYNLRMQYIEKMKNVSQSKVST